MAKTATQRQQDCRKQRPFAGPEVDGERRLHTWLATSACLARKRHMLEQLLHAADEEILLHLEPGTPAWDDYFNPPELRRNGTRQKLVSSFPDEFFHNPYPLGVKTITPRHNAKTIQLAFECPSSFAGIRNCIGQCGLAEAATDLP